MANRPFTDLYDYILPYVPSAETGLVDFHIRRVAREFCRRTTLWRRRIELTTEAGIADYILIPYEDTLAGEGPPAEICDPYSVLTVTCDGREIPPIAESARKPYGARPNNDKPKAWYQPSARVLHLYPAPDAVYSVVVDIVCALTMEPALNEMPEFLITDYREVLADGVVASLKLLNGKPWYDPEGAREFGIRFRNSTQAVRSRLRDAYRPGSFVARGPTFGK